MTQQIGGIASERLKSFVERIERLEEEKRALADDIKEVYSEAKGVGFDTKTIRQIVRLRRMDVAEREEYEALLDLYKAALGMLNGTPLGQAAVRRVTQKKPAETPSGGDGGEIEATAGAAAPEPPSPPEPQGISPEDIETARAAGRAAAAAGKTIYDNPYTARDPRRAAWDEEWCKAAGSDGMDIPEFLKRNGTKKPPKGGGEGGDEQGKPA